MFVQGMLTAAGQLLVTLDMDARLIDAAKLLAAGAELVVVVDGDGRPQGVVTKTDVVRWMSSCEGAGCTCPVQSAMTDRVVVCWKSDALQDVSRLMRDRDLKNILVVEANNRPVGVLNARAVLRALLGDAQYEEAQLVDYVKGVGYR